MRLRDYEKLRLNQEDIRQKFGNTFVHASHSEVNNGAPTTMSIGLDGGECLVSFFGQRNFSGGQSSQLHSARVRTDDLDVLEVYPKSLGVIPFGTNDIVFARKNVARQWQVGLCQANTALFSSAGLPLRVDLAYANALFSATYKKASYRDLLTRFAEDPTLIAAAINNVYWMCKKNDKIVLNRNQIPLGSFVYGSFFVNKSCTDLIQELWDDLRLPVKTNGN